jgi:hypothetical protein
MPRMVRRDDERARCRRVVRLQRGKSRFGKPRSAEWQTPGIGRDLPMQTRIATLFSLVDHLPVVSATPPTDLSGRSPFAPFGRGTTR